MKRLADAAPENLRAMIAAARADAPPAAVLERILARVEEGAPPPRGGIGRHLVAIGGGAAVLLAITAGLLLRGGHAEERAAAAVPATAAPAPATTTPAPSSPPPVVSPLPDDEGEPAPPARTSAPRPRPHQKAPPPAPPPSEVSLVEEARAALAGRDHRAALAAAARHEKLYPAGVLVEEREAIRIEALAATGDAALASARLRDFARRFPRSSYRRHLEEVVSAP